MAVTCSNRVENRRILARGRVRERGGDDPADVDAGAPNGCVGATATDDPNLLFAQRGGGPGNSDCGMGTNDVFGGGNCGADIFGQGCTGGVLRCRD